MRFSAITYALTFQNFWPNFQLGLSKNDGGERPLRTVHDGLKSPRTATPTTWVNYLSEKFKENTTLLVGGNGEPRGLAAGR